jgi:hypothetical protein
MTWHTPACGVGLKARVASAHMFLGCHFPTLSVVAVGGWESPKESLLHAPPFKMLATFPNVLCEPLMARASS